MIAVSITTLRAVNKVLQKSCFNLGKYFYSVVKIHSKKITRTKNHATDTDGGTLFNANIKLLGNFSFFIE